MTPAALLILAQDGFIDRQIGALFCAKPLRRLRRACLLSWRRPSCGCEPFPVESG
ncbi:MAG TPA: hypothetical protein VN231_01705 [Allosphingosinicella sp.]|nr:hypothetical protein [Allosphingosinicella sp.]